MERTPADLLAADGIDVEVIDLRTGMPRDMGTVLASVRRTGRAVVVTEAPRASRRRSPRRSAVLTRSPVPQRADSRPVREFRASAVPGPGLGLAADEDGAALVATLAGLGIGGGATDDSVIAVVSDHRCLPPPAPYPGGT